jgi:drug/metabolite transporter (DMT)-like permease
VFYGCIARTQVFGSLVAGSGLGAESNKGYAWMTANILITAMYILYLKYTHQTTSFTRLETVFCNNIIATPFVVWLLLIRGMPAFTELRSFDSYSTSFFLVLFLNCVCGFLLNFSCFWTIQQTSPTTYTYVFACMCVFDCL